MVTPQKKTSQKDLRISTNPLRERHTLRGGKLELLLRSDSQNYHARTYVIGKRLQKSTKENRLFSAKKIAEDWYDDLIAKVRLGISIVSKTFDEIKPNFLEMCKQKRNRSKSYYPDMKHRCNILSRCFGGIDVRSVSPKKIDEYFNFRMTENPNISPNTISKELVTLSQFLKYCARNEFIDVVPIFPSQETTNNPRPYFTQDEWKHLLAVARERIEKCKNVKIKKDRQELYWFMVWMAHGFCRVGELLDLTRDRVRIFNHENRDDDYLEVNYRGKTGMRTTYTLKGSVRVMEQIDRYYGWKSTSKERIFRQNHSRAFAKLLDSAELRYDSYGRKRDMVSCRHTCLMWRLLDDPSIPMKGLAQNAGTSIEVLDKYYLSHITTTMMRSRLISTASSRKPKKRKVNKKKPTRTV